MKFFYIFNWDHLLLASHPEARNIVDRDYLLLASHPEARNIFTLFSAIRIYYIFIKMSTIVYINSIFNPIIIIANFKKNRALSKNRPLTKMIHHFSLCILTIINYLLFFNAACAAANLAIGTLNGLQDT